METVPVWVVLVILSALGALCLLLIGIVKAHLNKDARVHEKVAVHEESIRRIDKEIYRPDGIMDRLHDHGSDIHTLLAKDEMRDRHDNRKGKT